MPFDIEKALQIVMECRGKKRVDEILNKHGIKKYTYYKWRRELIDVAFDLLKRDLSTNGDCYYNLYKENELLKRKVEKLELEKARWELKYKMLYWDLPNYN